LTRLGKRVDRAAGRSLALTVALTLTWGGLAGCGASGDGGSVVAEPIAPATATTETGVAASHAVEPVAGDDGTTAPSPTAAKTKVPARARAAPTSASAGHRILSPADRASFARLGTSLRGSQGLAVSAIGLDQRVENVGDLRTAVAWSTSKIPVAMAVIANGDARAQAANLTRAVIASDNAAAMRLWASLGGGQAAASAADEQLREGGDTHTSTEYRTLRSGGYTPFGQTDWALTDQVRFTAGLACSQPGGEVLSLMNQVVSSQRWGLGSAGVRSQFKGGWGPGSRPGAGGGYLDRQMGVLVIHGRPLAVAVATAPADGSHETGTRNLTAIARWLVAHADISKLPKRPSC
jgi:hypothetical protein